MSTTTIGIDIGSGAVKTVLFRGSEWLAKRCERIRSRDPMTLAQEGCDGVLADAGLTKGDVDYIATTGEGENVKFATGHFYSMTTHARGGVYLDAEARAVVDIGALNGRAQRRHDTGGVEGVFAFQKPADPGLADRERAEDRRAHEDERISDDERPRQDEPAQRIAPGAHRIRQLAD